MDSALDARQYANKEAGLSNKMALGYQIKAVSLEVCVWFRTV